MIEIRKCGGGMVSFGVQGNANTVYAHRFMACVSEYQDKKYGKGMRVHNQQGGKAVGHSRCTVCGSGLGIVRN